MITIPDLTKILTMENRLIHDQANGFSTADTLIQPQPSGNCMNWVLGHLLENQITMLETLGGKSPLDKLKLTRYARESEPIIALGPGILTVEELLADHDQIFAEVIARLGSMTSADFDENIQVGERTHRRGWRVFFLHFHYTYHIGQLEQLRQLAGHIEKVI